MTGRGRGGSFGNLMGSLGSFGEALGWSGMSSRKEILVSRWETIRPLGMVWGEEDFWVAWVCPVGSLWVIFEVVHYLGSFELCRLIPKDLFDFYHIFRCPTTYLDAQSG